MITNLSSRNGSINKRTVEWYEYLKNYYVMNELKHYLMITVMKDLLIIRSHGKTVKVYIDLKTIDDEIGKYDLNYDNIIAYIK